MSYTIDTSVNNVLINPKKLDSVFICNRSNSVYLMTLQNQVIKTFSTERKKCIVNSSLSHDGEFLYCVDEDNILYTFYVAENILRNFFKIHEKDVIGLIHHPNRSLLASYAMDGLINIYI